MIAFQMAGKVGNGEYVATFRSAQRQGWLKAAPDLTDDELEMVMRDHRRAFERDLETVWARK